MRLRVAAVMLVVAWVNPLPAQMRFEQDYSRTQKLPVSYEAVSLFSGDTARQVVNVHYRIGQHFFIFVRNEQSQAAPEYVAHGDLAIELLNDQKVSAAREIRQISLSRRTLLKEVDHPPAIQGIVTFSVPPGNYTVVFNLDDHESGRSFIEKTRKVRVPKIRPLELMVSDQVLVQFAPSSNGHSTFVPMNRGGNSLFGEAGGIASEILHPENNDTLRVHWNLHGVLDGFGERTQVMEDSAFTTINGVMSALQHDEGISYETRQSSAPLSTVFIPMPLQMLEPGMFTLDIDYRWGSVRAKQQHQFHVVWPARPFSLLDQDLAIDALRYIAKEPEMEKLLSGGATKRAEAFAEFWHERSRDTSTAYNQVMAEYYYRVDDALRRFSTNRESDGYKTDRGRIYILYGPPQKSDRSLQPNAAPTETWTYDRLHRKFIFIDVEKNGNYVLSQSENL
jgi:GWxTD domain-containing protein